MKESDFQPYRIALITEDFSGSNCVALYKYLTSHQSIFDALLVIKNREHDTKTIEFINSSKVLVYNGSYPVRFHKDQIVIQTWHGFSLRTFGVLSPNDLLRDEGKYVAEMLKVDIILSYSRTYRTFYNACFPTSCVKYRDTGMPKNDFLFLPKDVAESNLRKILNVKKTSEKFILYMSDYRFSGYRKNNFDQKLNFDLMTNILSSNFLQFLRQINALLFLKLNPIEERFFGSRDGMDFLAQVEAKDTRVFLITDQNLEDNFTDLYELLPCFDLLITDYSSIAYDWLLTDKPIIHFIPEEDESRQKRDVLAEPIEFWLPGVITKTLKELQSEIERSFDDNRYGRDKRERIKKIVHKFIDFKSSERTFNVIKELVI